jgi:hypothetical protein
LRERLLKHNPVPLSIILASSHESIRAPGLAWWPGLISMWPLSQTDSPQLPSYGELRWIAEKKTP